MSEARAVVWGMAAMIPVSAIIRWQTDGGYASMLTLLLVPPAAILATLAFWRMRDERLAGVLRSPATLAQMAVIALSAWSAFEMFFSGAFGLTSTYAYLVDRWQLDPFALLVVGGTLWVAAFHLIRTGPWTTLKRSSALKALGLQLVLQGSVAAIALLTGLWENDPVFLFSSLYVPLPLGFLALVTIQRDDPPAIEQPMR